jgi:cell wall-associated NlpC family hydrolase
MTQKLPKVTRLLVAVLFVLPAIVVLAAPSSFADSLKQRREAARTELRSMQEDLEVAIEDYNLARYRLDQAKARELEAQRMKREADTDAAAAHERLNARAIAAYTGAGSQISTLFDASSLAEFSDRLQYMGAVAQSDADLATEAEVAGERARWAADRYAEAVAGREKEFENVEDRLGSVRAMLDRQAELVADLDREWRDFIAAQQAALEAAQDDPGGGGGWDGGGGFVPPPNATKAQIAIAAARSVIGAPYVWGSADPDVGFDCSGLTMWAWGHAGVYLPHSSAAQYATLPLLPYSQAQPGDILFFFSPVSHVALYIGGGQMIHARHPGPGGQVQEAAVSSYATPVAAGRPS